MKLKNTLPILFLFFIQTSCMELFVSKGNQQRTLYIPQDIIQTIVSNFNCQQMSRFKRVCHTFNLAGDYWMIDPTIIQKENIDQCTDGLICIAHAYAKEKTDVKKLEQRKNFIHVLKNESQQRQDALKLLEYDESTAVEKIISIYSGNFTQTNPTGWTRAFENSIIGKILCSSVNPNIQYEEGNTLLDIAYHCNRIDMVKLLLNNKKIKIDDTFIGLYLACRKGYLEVVELLLDSNKINLNAKIEKQFTPLHIACQEGQAEIVKLLLNDKYTSKINLDIQCLGYTSLNICGFTALDIAQAYGHTEIIELLTSKNASRNLINYIPKKLLVASGLTIIGLGIGGAYTIFKK